MQYFRKTCSKYLLLWNKSPVWRELLVTGCSSSYLQLQPLWAFGFYLKSLIGSFYYSQLSFLIKKKVERGWRQVLRKLVSIQTLKGKKKEFCKTATVSQLSVTLTADPIYLATGTPKMQIHISNWKNRFSALNNTTSIWILLHSCKRDIMWVKYSTYSPNYALFIPKAIWAW